MTKADFKFEPGEFLKIFIPILIAIIPAAIAWGVYSQKIQNLQAETNDINTHIQKIQETTEIRLQKNEDAFNSVNNQLTQIKTILDLRLPPRSN